MRNLKIVAPVESLPAGDAHAVGLAQRHLISLHDFTSQETHYLMKLAQQIKNDRLRYRNAVEGCSVAMIIEHSNLHTRLTYELAIDELGGRALSVPAEELCLGRRPNLKDIAKNLSRWVDAILVRVHSHQTVVELAQHATIPLINGLSDFEHPCQALADYFTLLECKGGLSHLTIAWVGDGNNVAHSLIYGAARLGVAMRLATPPGYEPDRSVIADAKAEGGNIALTHDPFEAVAGADAIYTDVWIGMGNEDEKEERQEVFFPYQVNSQLLRAAGPQAVFMHCQPARRGEEVTDTVMDSPRSVIYNQAENRLHMQKAIFLALLS